ncbi:Protein retinal degeneration B [Gryllus bimaculatus]|nr:Protein retinal degeneration B [Gryllus bimaculatus]
MNIPPEKGRLPSPFQLDEELSNLSIRNDGGIEYTDENPEDALYMKLYDPSAQLETGVNSNNSGNLSGTWEYVSPDSKNLDSIVDELGPEEVRWFYKSESDKRWLEFSGYDSLRIEFKYRQLYQEWHFYSNQDSWTEYPQKEADNTESALNFDKPSGVEADSRQAGIGVLSDTEHRIVVRGGMYEVDLHEWKCCSIYWPGEECGITRGNWFYDGTWQPLEVEQSNKMEMFHLEHFYGHKLSDYHVDPNSKIPKTVLHTLSFPEFHVDWYSPTEVYLYSEATPSKLVRTFTQKLGFQKCNEVWNLFLATGYRLYRGYKEHATQTDRPVDINHLVFVIHGIGQKMDTGRIIRNTSSFRDCVTWLKQKYFSTMAHRAEFFPVEWRSSLTLDGDVVDAITPHKLLGLRQLLNASAMDIMYYTSPLYGSEVQQGLSAELNRLYTMFTQRNPYFTANGGKVSVVAHSLGCVIVYDIVTGWRPDSWIFLTPSSGSTTTSEKHHGSGKLSDTSSNESRLLFQIENMFCLGSPLSVFLALRWRNPERNILPASLCQRFYNVFHPSDPVAYSRIAPIQIQAYHAGIHPSYDSLPLEPLVLDPASLSLSSTAAAANMAATAGASAVPTSSLKKESESDSETPTPSGTPSKERGWSLWGLMRASWKAQDGSGSPQCDPLSGAYWSNYDVAYFVLTRLFPDLEGDTETISTPASPEAGPK